jgi:phosphoglycolate phosphatase
LVIFDFDGTLADSAAWFFAVINDVARRYRFRETTPEEREALRSMSTREILRALEISTWKVPFIARHMRRRVSRHVGEIQAFPWVDALFERLDREGVTIAIVSSNTEANIVKVLGSATAGRVRAFGGGASLFGKAKKFERMVKLHGFAPSEVVSVGDEVRDIQAARQCGMDAIAVSWGLASEQALRAADPDAVVSTFEALTERLLPR